MKASVYPPDKDQIAYAVGKKCVDIDAERIRKAENKTMCWVWDCHM